MELRHLRYFVAVAEEGSVTVAAEKRLHTAQPSLSRQLRDLEQESRDGPFRSRRAGIELTPAGGRSWIMPGWRWVRRRRPQAAGEAARPAAAFSIGFLTGQEVDWLPLSTQMLRTELPNLDFKVSSRYSPDVADALQSGATGSSLSAIESRPDLIFKWSPGSR
jgi:LysR family hca operon transcriptional activator